MRSRSPWKTLSKRVVYRNPWTRMDEHRVIQPDGSPSIYGVLSAPPYVGVLPYDRGSVYLVRQWRYPKGRRTWEIPTGAMEKKESLRAAARRELVEETGLAARRWQSLGWMDEANGVSNIRGHFFVAQGFSPAPVLREGPEADLDVTRISWQEALRWIDQGRVSDAISVACLLKWDRMLRRRQGGHGGR